MQPLTYVAFLAVTGGAPAHQCDPARIAALAHMLESDRFTDRERAARELLLVGPPAASALRRVAATAGPDAKDRAEAVLRRIRREWASGGPAVAGMQMTLRCERDVFRTAEAVTMSVEVKNTSDRELQIIPPMRWDFSHAREGDGKGGVNWSSSHSVGRIRLLQITGEGPQPGGLITCGPAPRDRRVEIRVGQSVSFDVPVNRRGPIPAAEYEVAVEYYLYLLGLEKAGMLISNPVRFRVE